MLVRSSPNRLERLRLPSGALRVRWDSPLANGLIGLWVWNAENLLQDLTHRSPVLTFEGAALRGGAEGLGLDCSTGTTSGARLLFSTGSALNRSGAGDAGLSVFCRFQTSGGTPSTEQNIFGLVYAGIGSPYAILHINIISSQEVKGYRNSAGSLQSTSAHTLSAVGRPTSVVQSLEYGVQNDFYGRGALLQQTVTNVSAPNYNGTNDIFAFGYPGPGGAGNSQSLFYIGGVWSRPLSATEALLLEAEPYSLVEQQKSFLSMMASAPPPPPPPPGSYWGGYQTINWPSTNAGLRVRS